MSIRNELAKLYVRYVFRDEAEFDPIKTQNELNISDPPQGIAERCQPLETDGARAFWIDRQNAAQGVLIYLHGGAFYFGPVKEHWQYLAGICHRTQMAGIMVDHDLAPQRPYPAGMNAIYGLLETLDLSANWAMLGDSSGAAMAVSTAFRLRQAGKPLPKKLVLMSPWLDAGLKNPDIKLTEKDDVMMTVERLSNAARAYVGDAVMTDPDISPMFGDLDQMPPILMQIGTADLLLADCRKFHQKCQDAGAHVVYEEYQRTFHDFMMLGFLPEAKRAIASQVAFLTA